VKSAEEEHRIPCLSAMSLLQSNDGERGSYPEIVDELAQYGANVDDHLRNHGFPWQGPNGWNLSPAFDLNSTPTDIKQLFELT